MFEAIVVGALVACSAAYVLLALIPAAAQLRLARHVLRSVEGRPAMRWLRKAAIFVESRAQKRLAGCGNCGAATTVQRDETRR